LNGSQFFSQYYQHVKKLLYRGVPIDSVGFQFHISIKDQKYSTVAKIKDLLKPFIDLGVGIQITELDMMHVVDDQDLIAQTELYLRIHQACIELNQEYGKPVCKGIVNWGIAEDKSWFQTIGFPPDVSGSPLMFDKSLNPKPGFIQLHEYLSGLIQ